ncbi:hypothetical protein [Haliea sp. E17]|uniref:hypothetical protein n=1 Tax=Haliea sp. E17 TaxID=3401576 RepID=UPI003AAA88FB
MNKTLTRLLGAAACALALSLGVSQPANAAVTSGRAALVEAEAVVDAIDLDTRQVTLKFPDGTTTTVTAPEVVIKLEDVSIGDRLKVAYMTAVEGEVREPTEEELANPWVVSEKDGAGMVDGQPTAGVARVIRAVCTIEGMNRLLRTVTVLDPKGRVHVIGDVEPAKMAGVTLGQTVFIEYQEALAMTLEPVGKSKAE